MKLEWSRLAIADRDEIFERILADNPRAAIAVDELIGAQIAQLAAFPESGRRGRVKTTREWVITNTPYVVAYRVFEDRISVLRILHGARNWPDEMPD